MIIALLLATAVPAADAPAAATDEITVTGLREAEIRKTANDMVRTALPAVPPGGQYARWNVPVCPRIQGLADARLAARVLERFRAIATEVGAPVAKPDCKGNIVIRFTSDAAVVADRVFAKNADAALLVETLDREAIRKRPLPVRWWFGWQIQDGSGGTTGDSQAATTAMVGSGEAPTVLPAGPGAVTVGGSAGASLIRSLARVSLTAATALVDVDLANGYSLDAVTAQLAMALLGQAAVRNEVPPSLSILGLFRAPPAEAPRDLTAWDKALLKALYSIPANREQYRQRGMLVAAITKDRLQGDQ